MKDADRSVAGHFSITGSVRPRAGSGQRTRVQLRIRELPGERNVQAPDIAESVRREELLTRTRPAGRHHPHQAGRATPSQPGCRPFPPQPGGTAPAPMLPGKSSGDPTPLSRPVVRCRSSGSADRCQPLARSVQVAALAGGDLHDGPSVVVPVTGRPAVWRCARRRGPRRRAGPSGNPAGCRLPPVRPASWRLGRLLWSSCSPSAGRPGSG